MIAAGAMALSSVSVAGGLLARLGRTVREFRGCPPKALDRRAVLLRIDIPVAARGARILARALLVLQRRPSRTYGRRCRALAA